MIKWKLFSAFLCCFFWLLRHYSFANFVRITKLSGGKVLGWRIRRKVFIKFSFTNIFLTFWASAFHLIQLDFVNRNFITIDFPEDRSEFPLKVTYINIMEINCLWNRIDNLNWWRTFIHLPCPRNRLVLRKYF